MYINTNNLKPGQLYANAATRLKDNTLLASNEDVIQKTLDKRIVEFVQQDYMQNYEDPKEYTIESLKEAEQDAAMFYASYDKEELQDLITYDLFNDVDSASSYKDPSLKLIDSYNFSNDVQKDEFERAILQQNINKGNDIPQCINDDGSFNTDSFYITPASPNELMIKPYDKEDELPISTIISIDEDYPNRLNDTSVYQDYEAHQGRNYMKEDELILDDAIMEYADKNTYDPNYKYEQTVQTQAEANKEYRLANGYGPQRDPYELSFDEINSLIIKTAQKANTSPDKQQEQSGPEM